MLLIQSISIIIFIFIQIVNCWQDYDVESLGQLNETFQLFNYSMKVNRINRTTYAISGTYGLKKELRNYTVCKQNMV